MVDREYKVSFGQFVHDLRVLTSDFSAYQAVTRTDSTSKAHWGLKLLQEKAPEIQIYYPLSEELG